MRSVKTLSLGSVLARFASCATLALVPLLSTACLPSGDGPSVARGERVHAIRHGTPAVEEHHSAVVAIVNRFSATPNPYPFCTGTLISETAVLTAGHCVFGGVGNLSVYFGQAPLTDPGRYVDVSHYSWHPSYTSRPNYDAAVLHLAEPVTDVEPIAPLPPALGLDDKIGETLEFVGFGFDEFGQMGKKARTFNTLDALGCDVPGCAFDGSSFAATQFSYSQPLNGTCQGDSGGPAFLLVDDIRYVAGLTSYGDANCTQFGVSARVDGVYAYVDGQVDLTPPVPPAPDLEPPVLDVTWPLDGAVLQENAVVRVVANVIDDSGAQAELVWGFSDDTFSCPLNGDGVSCERDDALHTWSINVSTGERTFFVRADDGTHPATRSESRRITLADLSGDVSPPQLMLSAPAEVLPETPFDVVLNATDETSIARVELHVDSDVLACPSARCSIDADTFTWTLSAPVGELVVQAFADDGKGQRGASEFLTVVAAAPDEDIDAGPEPSADAGHADADAGVSAAPEDAGSAEPITPQPLERPKFSLHEGGTQPPQVEGCSQASGTFALPALLGLLLIRRRADRSRSHP